MLLVTGATGFVGKGLQDTLLQRGLPFRATSRHAGEQLFPIGNIDADTDWSMALAGVDVVIHLASVNQNVVEDTPAVIKAYRSVNVDGTVNLAKQAAAAGVKRFVFVSTIKVHGEYTARGKPFTAADAPDPQTDYAATKLEAEQKRHGGGRYSSAFGVWPRNAWQLLCTCASGPASPAAAPGIDLEPALDGLSGQFDGPDRGRCSSSRRCRQHVSGW
jgi:nucleoside-diphosphate-sugar epimerase